VDDIPDAVDIRDLVGEKLDRIKERCDTDDPPVVEDVQPAGQLNAGEFLQQAEDGDGSVKIYPGGSGGAEG
jgi:hypothetical protein